MSRPGDVGAQAGKNWPDIYRFVLSLIIALFVGIALFFLIKNIGVAPTTNQKGEVVVDPFDQASAVVAIVAPFLTLVIGYWFGSKGSETAKQEAISARKDADESNKRAQLIAGEAAPEIVTAAMAKYDQLFNKN